MTVPGAQSVGWLVPTGQNVPAPHVTQSLVRSERKPTAASTLWSACVPPGQGCGALEPWTQRYPAVQSSQAVCPLLPWYLPALHSVHMPMPSMGVTLPGKQSRQTAALEEPGIGLALPAAHAVHDASLLAPVP